MKGELSQFCQFCRKMAERGNSTALIHLKRAWRVNATQRLKAQNGNYCGLHKNWPNDKITIYCSCVIKSFMLLLLQFPQTNVSGCIWVRLSDTPIGHSVRWNEWRWSRSQYHVLWPKNQPKHCITAHTVPQAVPQQFYGVAAELVLLGGPLSSGCVSKLNAALSQNIQRCSVQPSVVLTSQLICVQIQSMCFCSVNKTV